MVFWHGVLIQRAADLITPSQSPLSADRAQMLVKALVLRSVIMHARTAHALLQQTVSRGVLGLGGLETGPRAHRRQRRVDRDDRYRRRLFAEMLFTYADSIDNVFGDTSRLARLERWISAKRRRVARSWWR